MKKTTSFMSIIIAICFVFSITPVTFAKNQSLDNELILLEERAKAFVGVRENGDYVISDWFPLYNTDGEAVAVCYFLSPCGYVIVNRQCEVTEAAFDKTKSYRSLISHKNNTVYYGGPLCYFTKTNNCYFDIATDSKVDNSDAIQVVRDFSNYVTTAPKSSLKNIDTDIQPMSILESVKLPGVLRTYSYNTGNICGSTAAAILLMYYRDYKDSWVVPSWHDTATGQSLIELLVPEINGNPPQGALCDDVARGLNFYFRWRGISDSYSATWSENINYDFFKSLINSNRPFEVLINNHPTYQDHFVVAHGVEKEYHGSNYYYYIYAGDGWGSNNVLIGFSYIKQLAYINK